MNNLTENEKATLEWLLLLGSYKLKELQKELPSQGKYNPLYKKRKQGIESLISKL